MDGESNEEIVVIKKIKYDLKKVGVIIIEGVVVGEFE